MIAVTPTTLIPITKVLQCLNIFDMKFLLGRHFHIRTLLPLQIKAGLGPLYITFS